MVPDREIAGGSGDLSSATADARIRTVSPDVGFLLCILFCFSVLCFVPNVVGVVHP
jgi:hypothetical protein